MDQESRPDNQEKPTSKTVSLRRERDQNNHSSFEFPTDMPEHYDNPKFAREALHSYKGKFAEWLSMDFETFLADETFQSLDSLVGYFVDHPNIDISQVMRDLHSDQTFDEFKTRFFTSDTKLNAWSIGKELQRVTQQRRKLLQEQKAMFLTNLEKADTVLAKITNYNSFPFDEDLLFIVPSRDILNYVTGHRKTNLELHGITGIPKKADSSHTRRASIVALPNHLNFDGFTINASTDFSNTLLNRSYFHETEHARAFLTLDVTGKKIKAGFKQIPVLGEEYQDVEFIQNNKDYKRDEGMTELMAIIKDLIITRDFNTTISVTDLVNLAKNSVGMGVYTTEVYQVINDIEICAEKVDGELKEDSLKKSLVEFMRAYQTSSSYPFDYIVPH